MFIDIAEIKVISGHGGAGSVSFCHEKYVPKGGPDGGDGGKGGNVIVVADNNLKSLMDFNYKTVFQAEAGQPGEGRKKAGKAGKDIVIRVPVGTLIKIKDSDKDTIDLTEAKQTVVIANGGMGGKGNARFATSTNQTPYYSQKGTPEEIFDLVLELKLLADVGIIGLPNAGKSSLLANITASKPKIANYPFTTLIPNLGVAEIYEGKQLVFADIPGLIENAHNGKGLGFQFLRHISRTKLLMHILDVSDFAYRDIHNDFEMINNECAQYSVEVANKKQIIVFNKIDSVHDRSRLKELANSFKNYKIVFTSAATGEGIKNLLDIIAVELV